jgi:hypothetical protein
MGRALVVGHRRVHHGFFSFLSDGLRGKIGG